jgi:RNA polymerase sigma-70 factor (ECF subfamily)
MAAIEARSLGWFSAERAEAEVDLTALVREYSGLLYRVAFSVVRNAEEAEDVVQDTFVRVLRQRGKLAGIVEMRPWLVRIAWNLALDRRRRIRPEQMDEAFAAGLAAKGLGAERELVERQRMTAVLREMEKLPAAERKALLLSANEELSAAEMGKVLGRTESAVRGLLFRARTRLKARLEKGGLA